MHSSLLVAAIVAESVHAFPFMSSMPGIDMSLLKRDALVDRHQARAAAACPNNPNHTAAVPINSKYPYCGALNGQAGTEACPNNTVPAPGDTAHYYKAPGKNDIRGPCPGINTAANHNFLAHDGVTTFNELVDMQQNVYGVGYDLSVLLATLGLLFDGDPITEKLSIGCDATSRTAAVPILSAELGLNGHNKFEGDSSLTRNDLFLANGDNYSFNKTLFAMMAQTAGNNFGHDQLALYRYQRYQQSRRDNPNFYFGPKSLLLYGAASFLYELFPSLGNAGTPDLATQMSFFYDEKIPANWSSRATPYSVFAVGGEIGSLYNAYPVEFGGNAGKNNFFGFGENGGTIFNNGMFNGTAQDLVCLIYQFATENQPSSLQGNSNIATSSLQWAASKLNPVYTSYGYACPLNFNGA